jgi:Rrf2 family transcriptional regulator, cysteine metabolism repressor
MELSARVEYALAALLELTNQLDSAKPLQIKSIATKQNIPYRYLEHIFNTLSRAGIVRGQRGTNGGYWLARQPQKITLLEIFECFEDNRVAEPAQTDLSLHRSIIRDAWRRADQSAKVVLQQLTLHDLRQQGIEREQAGNMYYI